MMKQIGIDVTVHKYVIWTFPRVSNGAILVLCAVAGVQVGLNRFVHLPLTF